MRILKGELFHCVKKVEEKKTLGEISDAVGLGNRILAGKFNYYC